MRLLRPVLFLSVPILLAVIIALPRSIHAQTSVPPPTPTPDPLETIITLTHRSTLLPHSTPTPTPFVPSLVPSPTSTAFALPTPFPTPTLPPGGVYPTWTPTPYRDYLTPTSTYVQPTLRFGQPVIDVLSPQMRYRNYSFFGEAGQVVVVNMTVPGAVPRLYLGYEVYYENAYPAPDANGNFRLSLVRVLPYTGEHFLSIDDSMNSQVWERAYSLAVSLVLERPIAFDEPITDILAPDMPVAVYRFSGEQGDLVSLSVESERFVPMLILAANGSGGGNPELASTGSGYGGNSSIGLFPLPYTGEYIVLVRSLNEPIGGPYTLTLNRIEPLPITLDEPVQGEFTEDVHTIYYTFDVAFGDILDIGVEAENGMDTAFMLFSPQRQIIQSDDDSGAGLNPELQSALLTFEGAYILQVVAQAGETGAFTLHINRSATGQLENGPQIARPFKPIGQNFTLQAQAGDTVRVSLRLLDGPMMPSVRVTQYNQEILAMPFGRLTRLTAEFVVPQDGKLFFNVSDTGSPFTRVEISAEVVEEAD